MPKEKKVTGSLLDLWVANKMVQDSAAYNLVCSYSLNKFVEESSVANAINVLSQKFEDLCANFHETQEGVKVVFEDAIDNCMESVYIDSTVKYSEIIHNFVNKKIDTASSPLWKVLFVNFPFSNQELWFNFHHLVADGNSLKVYIECYDAILQEKTADIRETSSIIYSELPICNARSRR
ncbi:MAG: condensation domain-containing protein [Holosporaceae bacterium]|jgi:NRPS condensation-like uncharacterized protein|nr:condensation domain-containing protein [Holosporaceae bacterium]